jgi:predicted metalloprotease
MGGGGFPIPMRAGGGVLGIIVLLATIFLPKLLGGVSGSSAADVSPSSESSDEEVDCPTEIEQIVCGAVDEVQPYWTEQLPVSFDVQYEPTDTVFFTGFTNTGCGQASSQTGPFYCPLDKLVYFDLDFLVQLQDQLGASGDLAAQYIVAHEYGHHVQNVLGINAQMHEAQQNDPDRANQYSIALELQADCFAGAWARDVADEGKFDNPQEVEEALNAAAAVGDDRIQQQTQGRVSPETWTHGSSEQRVEWFRRGFDSADPGTCDTFAEII